MKRFFILLTTILLMVTSCTSDPSTAEPQSIDNPETQDQEISAYPAPGSLQAPYPGENDDQEPYLITEIPPPQGNKTTITGILLSGIGEPEPASGIILSLASLVVGSEGTPALAKFDRDSAPKTLTDDVGRFVFQDVEPGQYALIVDLITQAFLLNEPVTGGDFLFEGINGEILDLGEIIHPDLPAPE